MWTSSSQDTRVLTWLALGIAFLIFSIFIVDVLMDLTPKKEVRPVQFESRNQDELTQLERLTKNALDESNPDAAKQLFERLRSVELRAAAYRINMSDADLADAAQSHPDLVEGRLGDLGLPDTLTSPNLVLGPGSDGYMNSLP